MTALCREKPLVHLGHRELLDDHRLRRLGTHLGCVRIRLYERQVVQKSLSILSTSALRLLFISIFFALRRSLIYRNHVQ